MDSNGPPATAGRARSVPNPAMNDSRRLEMIEEKLLYLERTVAELNDVVLRQQREIDTALARGERLVARLEALGEPSGADATAFEKPPHY